MNLGPLSVAVLACLYHVLCLIRISWIFGVCSEKNVAKPNGSEAEIPSDDHLRESFGSCGFFFPPEKSLTK